MGSTSDAPVIDLEVVTARKRDDAGRFAPGHLENLKDGSQAKALLEVPIIAEAYRAKVDALLTDRGGDDVSTVMRDHIEQYAAVSIMEESYRYRLLKEGLTNSKGKARAAVAIWMGLCDRADRLRNRIPFERAPKVAGLRERYLTNRSAE